MQPPANGGIGKILHDLNGQADGTEEHLFGWYNQAEP